MKGRNDLSTVPDFKFEYGNNPRYWVNSWDGWGMYAPNGNSSGTSHRTNDPDGRFGASWSLTKVTSPLGAEMIFNYERDTYSSISGETVLGASANYSASNYVIHGPVREIPLAPGGNFFVDDKVKLVGGMDYFCSDGSGQFKPVNDIYTITRVSANSFTVDRDYIDTGCNTSDHAVNVEVNGGTATKILTNKEGGNLRVGSVTLRDDSGMENKIRYIYKNDDGSSSGVVSVEPEYIKSQDFEFYNYLKYPQTPVMYSKVSVLTGKLTTDADYVSKEVFEFETPNKTMLTFTPEKKGHSGASNVLAALEVYHFKIEDRTSMIGRLNAVRIFDKNNPTTPVSSSELTYTSSLKNTDENGYVDNYQGFFTEGTLLADITDVIRNNRTTVITYPNALQKTVNTNKDGFTSWTENRSWDINTGAVLEKVSQSALGIKIKTVVKPAYKAYDEMGPKGQNINYRNMLTQVAETYTYRLDAGENVVGLMSAEVQTWKSNWSNYRVYNNKAYSDSNEPESIGHDVWRKGPAYIFKGDAANLNFDGTLSFSTAENFDFGVTPGPKWQKMGEVDRFDHFSMPLQSKDLSGIYSAVKMGYDNRTLLCEAVNAKYNEIAFSSAEDRLPIEPGQTEAPPFFGGEVGMGDGKVTTTLVHTGQRALEVKSGYGFVFKTEEATMNRSYRVSVWASSPNGKIYYKVGDNGAEQIPAQTVSKPVEVRTGTNWYRIDATIKKADVTSSTLEVGVKSAVAPDPVIFDDFRFQPLDAMMTGYVFNPPDFEFSVSSSDHSLYTYTLNNDNLFMKMEYDEKGVLVKIYTESLTYGVKQIGESKTYYKRSTVNP
ncbi:MAG TPA: hypothetical protein VIU12_25345 [Chryseolinea sp.]